MHTWIKRKKNTLKMFLSIQYTIFCRYTRRYTQSNKLPQHKSWTLFFLRQVFRGWHGGPEDCENGAWAPHGRAAGPQRRLSFNGVGEHDSPGCRGYARWSQSHTVLFVQANLGFIETTMAARIKVKPYPGIVCSLLRRPLLLFVIILPQSLVRSPCGGLVSCDLEVK